LNEFQALRKSPGWAQLLEILNEQFKVREQAVFLTPCNSIDQTLEQEYKKGEGAALLLVMKMPDVIIANMEEEVRTTLAQLEKENQNVNEIEVPNLCP
jgi:hypothetical protein